MSAIATRLFFGGGVVISLFFFCMGCILKICVLRKKRRCTQKLQGRIASIEGFRTSNMPMVLIEFFWPERYLLPCLLESLSQPLQVKFSRITADHLNIRSGTMRKSCKSLRKNIVIKKEI